MVPKELGGEEADLPDRASACSRSSAYADGSTGWPLMANASSSAFAAILLRRRRRRRRCSPPGAPGIHTGMFGPGRERRGSLDNGLRDLRQLRVREPSPTARPGWPPARRSTKDGEPVRDRRSGLPSLLVGFPSAPKPSIFCGATGTSWGSRAPAATTTQSEDPVRLRDGFTFRLLEAEPHRAVRCIASACSDSSRPGMPALRWASASGHSSRCSRSPRASNAWAASNPSPRSSCSSTSSRCTTPRCARHVRTSSSRSLRPEACSRWRRRTRPAATDAAGDDVRDPRRRRCGAVRVHGAGTDALRNPSTLQRCFRDIHAGTQHIYVDNNTLTETTRVLLGLEH